ncbi:hypothetical protein [Vibrio jasicida]|uniref:hypothetical protein n=1 Tax=Vibrio jasicida TaxID=766224 RepID=UPI0005EE5AF6|nr:hypothetical protein [Vibrio jasicida]
MIRIFALLVGLVFGVSSNAAQETTFSWRGVIPTPSSELNESVVTKSSDIEANNVLSSKQESHPQLTISSVVHEATNTEIKILKTEL